MMHFKSIFFFLIVAFTSVISLDAQPIFTYAAFSPHNGDQYTMGHSGGSYAGSAGPNQTWNFSTAPIAVIDSFIVYPTSSVPVASYYPNATQAIGFWGAGTMLNVNTSDYLNYGTPITPGMPGFIYTDPEKVFAFPMNYGDSFNDIYQGQNYSGPEYRIGNVTVTYEGYGTIITPYNTYTNVICIHSQYTQSDTTSSGWSYCNFDYYHWFAPGYRYPVADSWYIPGGPSCGMQSYGTRFLQSIAIGYDELTLSSPGIHISPNPFSSDITVKIINGKQGDIITISDITGRVIHSFPFYDEQMDIQLGELEDGIYLIRINDGRSTKIIKTKFR